jgi:hypothetical protein
VVLGQEIAVADGRLAFDEDVVRLPTWLARYAATAASLAGGPHQGVIKSTPYVFLAPAERRLRR